MIKPTPIRLLSFLAYYSALRVNVLIGLTHTSRPLGLAWRWRHWRKMSR